MNINQVIYEHYNKESTHKRQIGIYWATDIKKIKAGELTYEDFLNNKRDPIDWKGIGNIFTGCAYEAELIKILKEEKVKCTPHKKKDFKIGKNIILRANLDIWFLKAIAECKAPTKLRFEIPEWYKDQAEVYHRVWKRNVYFYFFVPREYVEEVGKLIIEIPYKPSILRWKNIVKTLKEFDKGLNEFNKQLKTKSCDI